MLLFDYVFNLGCDFVKDGIANKSKRNELHDALEGYFSKKKIENYDCSLDDEIDFTGLIEYISQELHGKLEKSLLGKTSEERDQAHQTIINQALIYAHVQSDEAQKQVRRIIGDSLNILRDIHWSEVPEVMKFVATTVVDDLEEKMNNQTKEILLAMDTVISKVPNALPDDNETVQGEDNITDKACITDIVRIRDSDIKQFENICDVLQKAKYWLVEYDMGGPIPQVKLEGLFELCYQEDDPFMEFIDPVLEAARKKLINQIKIFYGEFSVYMFPQELPIGDCWVPHMWLSNHGEIPMPDDEKKKTFEQEVKELNTLATNVWEEYKGFVRQVRYYMEKA